MFVAGYGDVGKGVAHAFQRAAAEVVVSEVDPICALQARMAGFRVSCFRLHVHDYIFSLGPICALPHGGVQGELVLSLRHPLLTREHWLNTYEVDRAVHSRAAWHQAATCHVQES